jgi:cytochrome P450
MIESSSVLDRDFDPWAEEHLEDPVSVYEAMRVSDPVHWNEHRKIWFLTRYADVMGVLRDRQSYSAAAWQKTRPHMENASTNVSRDFTGETMLTTEPPNHTRLRRPADPSFSPKSMKTLEATIEKIADRLLDAVSDQAEWDVIENYAFPLPVLVMAALIGIPEEDETEFLSLVTVDGALLAIDPIASQEQLDRYGKSGAELGKFVERIIEKKRSMPPASDLITVALAEEAEERWTTLEVLSTIHLMMEAGHVTTVNLIGNGINLLLKDPSNILRLSEDPTVARSAVEECLRLDGPVHFVGRIAIEAVEIGGRSINEGDIVMCLFPAANRDPEQFPEPQEFLIDRTPNAPAAFGAGLHHCIGAPLARIEAMVAFKKLCNRFPTLRQVREGVRQPTFELRGFKELFVTCQNSD